MKKTAKTGKTVRTPASKPTTKRPRKAKRRSLELEVSDAAYDLLDRLAKAYRRPIEEVAAVAFEVIVEDAASMAKSGKPLPPPLGTPKGRKR